MNSPYTVEYDLTNCDKEPIHIIRYVQRHALLLACHLEKLSIEFISDNCMDFFEASVQECLGKSIKNFLPNDVVLQLQRALQNAIAFEEINPILISNFRNEKNYNLIAHLNSQNQLVIELEPAGSSTRSIEFQMQIGAAISRIQAENKIPRLLQVATQEVKKLTNYDRVMVYKFDEEGHGEVIAESLNDNLEPYLGLRYPATDIPKQARELLKKNQVRFIYDLAEHPALLRPAVHPETQQPFDQTYGQARGTSPIHVEYLLNMGVCNSMTIAILKHGELWGIISCHNYSKIWLDYPLRKVIKLIGQMISGHLVINSAMSFKENLLEAQMIKNRLLDQMLSEWDAIDGLARGEVKFTDLFDCSGGCIYTKNEITSIGKVPNESFIKKVVAHIETTKESLVWKSHRLIKDIPELAQSEENFAGVLILIISESPNPQYLLWFRKEKKYEVNWGGNPEKSVIKTEAGLRLSPRKSFDKWQQVITQEARKWTSDEVNIAINLRSDIKEFFLKKYQELQVSNSNLMHAYEELDSFSYTVAHDLRAPLRSIKGFTQILTEDYSDKLDAYGQHVINVILKSTDKMNTYIDHILNIAKLGRNELKRQEIDMDSFVRKCYQDLFEAEKMNYPDRKINFSVPTQLPLMQVDPVTIIQVFENIIGNAIKYSRPRDVAEININYKDSNSFHQIEVIDNGIGFDEKYKDKVFEIFHRLTSDKSFEGTGVGMAIAQKIIHKHEGKIDCRSTEGKGTTFVIYLPKNKH